MIAGVLNVSLSFVLSSYFGVIGAAMSIFVAYMFRAIATNVVCHRIMHLNIPKFALECYARMSVPMIITLLAGWGVNLLINDGGWTSLLIKGGIIVAVYLVLVLLIGLTRQERSKIIGFVKKSLKRVFKHS